MLLSHIRLKNWRNFQLLEAPLRHVTYVLGPNASGKSNLLDALRFLRDVSKRQGGGLQAAIADRDGISKVRCLHARRDPEVEIDIELSRDLDQTTPSWRYVLAFKPEGKGAQRLLVSREQVWRDGDLILDRPNSKDKKDTLLLTQTHLEQIQTNQAFRELAEFLSDISYLHLVPQLLRFGEKIGGNRLTDDPFGQGFLERLAHTPEKTRNARLKKIGTALTLAVPQFAELRFDKDDMGHPHLQARYQHHRPNAGWQSEEHFSDGTLRLFGLLWMLLEGGNSMLLLEEPEISLNDAIVAQIPLIIERLQRGQKNKRQVLVTTHSEALLSNHGIDERGVVLLESGKQGTTGRIVNNQERQAVLAGLTVAEVLLPKTRPSAVSQLGLWQ
ncbi:MAG: chromosome segregation protein SMC [Acidovorax sp. SCN 65-108]|jgi:predicted ATPase|nr:MAG: chromosome segregation protein SMC [Acidovorax sp. SCN 65-108]OJV74129.1 MAG: chromosome segregation protein SMC [Burkholderiales bacterium 64-34]